MNNKLYILGNGFDLYHGIKSSYQHFNEYVYKKDPSLSIDVDEYLFDSEENWCDFENSLGEVDPNRVYKSVESEYLKGNDYESSDIHAMNDAISFAFEGINEGFETAFYNWINSLDIPVRSDFDELLDIDANSTFLSFNYTDTLQKIYNVPIENVIHIHGKFANPIYGHGNLKLKEYKDEPWCPVDEMLEDLQRFFDNNKKDVLGILAQNASFFKSLAHIEEVHVIGHSLNDVDLPYFTEVKKHIKRSAKWRVTYYKGDEKDKHSLQLNKIGIVFFQLPISSYKTVNI